MRSEKAIGGHKGGFHVRGQGSAAAISAWRRACRHRDCGRSGGSRRGAAADARGNGAPTRAFVTLTALEAAFIVAAVDTLIPADELSPSGSDCGVAIFIDRQLGSAWGGGAKMYRAGPFVKGKPEQGYQLALTPREYFAAGITAANAWSRKTYGKEFDRLAPADRVTALKAMEDGKAQFENFDAKAFFSQLHGITMAGFFADPIYGGNRDMAGWKLVGFPGVRYDFRDVMERPNQAYTLPPVSMQGRPAWGAR
jgi:gluconate 2-dehydrogenase gamma chain